MANVKTDKGTYVNFPSHAVPDKEKAGVDYGLQVAKAIEFEWFAKDGNSTRFYANKQRFHSLRLYAQGDQDIRRYKDEFSLHGDLSYLNLDWTPVPIIPKFVDIVANGMADRGMNISAEASDPASIVERQRYIRRLRGEMENRELLQNIQEGTGVEVFENSQENLPGNEEELNLHLELDYKMSAEVAIEAAIDYEFEVNMYESIHDKVNHDLVSIGIGAVKHSFNPTEGIKIEYVDPSDLVYSDTNSKYFEDCTYFGEVKRVHITEIQKAYPHLTSNQIDDIIRRGSRYQDFGNIPYNQDQSDSQMVDLLYFCYKSVNNEIYKIKETPTGGHRALSKDESFLPPKDKRTGFKRTHRANEVIYEGVKVLGAEVLLKWDLAKNMIRPNANSPKTYMPYVVSSPKSYKGKLYSLVKRMEKYADAIQLIHLKLQQVVQRMNPSGIYVDADGLAEIDLGNGTLYNPAEAINMYFQTGSIVGRSMTESGDFNNARVPIQELPGSGGQQIQSLLVAYEYNLNQIRNVTGLNEARDGSDPDPDALVGVQKLAAANSNVATRHILFASSYITKILAEGVSLRIKDAIEYSPTKDDYITAIGKNNVEILDELGDVHLNEFGIFIELGPDEEERAHVESNIQQALSKDLIKPEDAIDVRRIGKKSPKLANELLKQRRRQREEKQQQFDLQKIESQAKSNAESAQAKELAEAQAEAIKTESKVKLEQVKSQLKEKSLLADVKAKKDLMDHEYMLGMKTLKATQESQKQMAREKNITDVARDKMKAETKVQKPFESEGNDHPGSPNLGGFEPQ